MHTLTSIESVDPQKFKQIALRNTLLPLGLAMLLSTIFVSIILQLVALHDQLNHSDRVIATMNEALALVIDAETGLRGYVITGQDGFRQPFDNSRRHLSKTMEDLKVLIQDNPVQMARLQRMERLNSTWNQYAEGILVLTDMSEARKVVGSERGKRLVDQIRAEVADFILLETNLRDQRSKTSRDSARFALYATLAASILFGAFLAFYSRRQLASVSNIYGKALEKADAQTRALQEQDWLRTAQAKAAERIRGDFKIEDVCHYTLAFLCEYLEAKVGALYLAHDNGLHLCDSYGLSHEDDVNRRSLKMGESLPGQAALENRQITLNPPPANYLKISSLLGAATPTSLLISPLNADGEVKAVVELGFARALDPRDQELLRLLSEPLGTAIRSIQYRARLQELLEEAQRQAEELQAQQEELRVNNEELEEQSSALKESQSQLQTQQEELEQTNSQLSLQAKSLERQNDDLVQARSALELKAGELQRASEYKSQFLANMSHELRTPLNSTLILSQLLIDNTSGHLSEQEVEYARTILSSSNDLLSLINDILDLSKVEAGKILLQPGPVELAQLVQSLQRTFSPIAEAKGLDLSFQIRSEAPAVFTTDRQRVEQILRNLLSNAIKFTNSGSVSLTITSPRLDRLVFSVKDTGIGVPQDKQRLIFEAFQQGDGTTNRQYGGTGLGLTISRDLAKLLRGDISLDSSVGEGSEFTLTIASLDKPITMSLPLSSSAPTTPLETAPELTVPRTPKPVAERKVTRRSSFPDDRADVNPGLKLLMVVEDDETFAKVMYDLSHEANFQCLIANTAEEAIELAFDYLPHAIILDMKLPDHSGLFVLDRLKENTATRHIPIHVISAQDDSQAALQMGAIGYLTKPATRSKVMDVIRRLEEKLSQGIKKVLIVEDNATQLESMKKLISYEGVEVVAVRTGAEAIDLLQSVSFDCLVLDLSLPDMSGHELLERMKDSESLSHPPVIVYTGRELSREEEESLQKHSRSIILKGAKSPERLLSEVGLFLHQVESKMPVERQKVLKELRDRERDLEAKRILLVDDDVRNIFALKNALEQRGAKVEIARNGREAVNKVQTIHQDLDLVLMDIMMPEMNGYEAMREIRKDKRFRFPIIAVTAKAMMDDQEKCLEAGANDYIAKPIDLPKLLSLIRIWLHPARKF